MNNSMSFVNIIIAILIKKLKQSLSFCNITIKFRFNCYNISKICYEISNYINLFLLIV